AIYKDVRGAPGQLLATTASGRLVPDTWKPLPITAGVEPRMSYWVLDNSNGTNTTVSNATYSPVTGDRLDRAIRELPTQFGNRITSMGDTEPMIVAIAAIGLLAAAQRGLRVGVLVLIGFGLALLVAWGVRETIFDPYLYPSGHALRA